ncbi:MAG TPA: protease pro-enzyme activation domain-containing protein, partial [Acidimicrobiales bacterium]|nr:protease pro-enzyme activation domain-containing protein [Acidimicrobiales bacterium]
MSRKVAATVTLLVFTALAPTAVADASTNRAPVGASSLGAIGPTLRLPAGARELGALQSSAPVRLSVVLAPSHAGDLAAYAAAVARPSSALYRHYLAHREVSRLFDPSPSVLARVLSELESAGLGAGSPMAGGLVIPLTTTAGRIDRAFHTSLERVRLATGKVAWFALSAPRLPIAVARSVLAIVGLD